MRDEIKVSYKNGTWELVEKLEKKKIVGCKWVCKIKQGISRVKAKGLKPYLQPRALLKENVLIL